MVKFDFKAIEKSMSDPFAWPEYWDENGEGIDFGVEDEYGNISIDDFPLSIEELESKGYEYKGSNYNFYPLYGKEVTSVIRFSPARQQIEVKAAKFTYDECIKVINMVVAQLKADDKNHSYCLYFGVGGDDRTYHYYHHDATHGCCWWNDFTKMFNRLKNKLDSIDIFIEEDEEDGENGAIIIQLTKKPTENGTE